MKRLHTGSRLHCANRIGRGSKTDFGGYIRQGYRGLEVYLEEQLMVCVVQRYTWRR